MSPNLTLWGRTSSANVQKTLWALEELGLPYTHKLVGGAHGGLDEPAYRAMNPNGLVPTLQDGDLTVWESHATLRYLAGSYGENLLWPADPRERALVDQWTDWTATTFQPGWIAVFWLFVRTPREQHDEKAITAAIGKTIAALRILDATLAERDYLVTIGIQPTFAETGYGYIRSGDELGSFHNITSSKVAMAGSTVTRAPASARLRKMLRLDP